MREGGPDWNYPHDLPVVAHRREILDALAAHRVLVVVSDTGSGKTTQLPKMVAEALGIDHGWIGCTQPRRIAAVSVAARVAAELSGPTGGFVGYRVRFDERLSEDTRIKFMTDGILLAETQSDPDLRRYRALIIDEAHERSLNIDFLLGYLKRLLARRNDLTVVVSSATLDAGAFAAFFADGADPVPVIEAPGRQFPVSECFLPAQDDEELPEHVARAVDWLGEIDSDGDVLVFLPGEREIRECSELLEGRRLPRTEVLPLYARLGLADQQRIFQPGRMRRLILATNVAETSLTIPRIACVIDSGLARVSRWVPGRGIQRLQVEPVSQASARQRKGRCGRLREGVCVRLYDEEESADRPEFTDPEIRRSSLAGVILRMKSLGLQEISEFPFIDPPSSKAIAEGYRTLREVGALDDCRDLTPHGRVMARLPVDPRLGRMLIEAAKEGCLDLVIPLVAALETSDPRERPSGRATEADEAHARWNDGESDFTALLRLWREVCRFRDADGRWKRNALRRFADSCFLNVRRIIEWANVADELTRLIRREWQADGGIGDATDSSAAFPYAAIHRCLLAGVPRQIGLWDREKKAYRGAMGGFFAVFPGSSLFGLKSRWEWVIGIELVETSRLWARRVARIDPEWIEQVAPHLCESRYGEAHWDVVQGAVYGRQSVICGGLTVVSGRRVHYGRIDPVAARSVFLREGLLGGGIRKRNRFVEVLDELHREVSDREQKLRRPGGLWSDEAVIDWLGRHLPEGVHSASAFHRWVATDPALPTLADLLDDHALSLDASGFPDQIIHNGVELRVYYRCEPGAADDGVTFGVHVDQLPRIPDWLPDWGVDGQLRERAEILIRSLPKDLRRQCQPVAALADGFSDRWCRAPRDGPLDAALAGYLHELTGVTIEAGAFRFDRLPPHLVTKVWVCDDDGNELASGTHLRDIRFRLSSLLVSRFEAEANEHIARGGLAEWDGEELPVEVQLASGLAYPALVDETDSVGIRAFLARDEAFESHRAGLARLLCLTQPDQAAHLLKHYPIDPVVKIGLRTLGNGGTSMDDLLLLAAEGALGGTQPRSPREFREVAGQARGEWFESAGAVGKHLLGTIEPLHEIQDWMAAHRDHRHLDVVVSDLDEQFAWLLRPRFAWHAGFRRLADYPRYLRAVRSRLGRLKSLPIAKDLEKMERMKPLWSAWLCEWTASPEDPATWETGWLLQEWRVSLFAPDLPVITRISEKRLAEKIEQMRGRGDITRHPAPRDG